MFLYYYGPLTSDIKDLGGSDGIRTRISGVAHLGSPVGTTDPKRQFNLFSWILSSGTVALIVGDRLLLDPQKEII